MKTTAIAFDDDPRTGRIKARLGLVSELMTVRHDLRFGLDSERVIDGLEQIVEDCLQDMVERTEGGAR